MSKVVPLRTEFERAFKAAKVSTLNGDWPTYAHRIDVDVRYGLRILRARARDAAQNNDHVKHFLRLLKTNVVGPKGIGLQSRATLKNGKADQAHRTAVETAWKDWGRVGHCDVTGRLSWRDLTMQAIETVARDGEALYRHVVGWQGNRYGYALQPIDVETLDVEYNAELSDGRVVVMGVELDTWRRPQAYYLTEDDPGLHRRTGYQSKRVRVPASEIIQLYLPEWVWQTRGVPWLHTALLTAHHLAGYEEAAVVAARAGASKMGFYEQDAEATPPIDPRTGQPSGMLGEGEDARGDLVESFEPGGIGTLPPGYKFHGWDPAFPNTDHAPFVKALLRSIASGFGVSYNTLANDLEGVNFSSLRQGALTERDLWMMAQEFIIEHFCSQVYERWLSAALYSGAVVRPNGTPVEPSRYEPLRAVAFQPRRWPWVDPQKDQAANEAAVRMRTRSISDIIRETGRDPDDVWTELAEDLERLKELGLDMAPTGAATQETPNDQADEGTEPEA